MCACIQAGKELLGICLSLIMFILLYALMVSCLEFLKFL